MPRVSAAENTVEIIGFKHFISEINDNQDPVCRCPAVGHGTVYGKYKVHLHNSRYSVLTSANLLSVLQLLKEVY